MNKQFFVFILMCFLSINIHSQVLSEVNPPYNLKTISFVQNGQNVIPIFQLGDSFQLQFDDLFGNEANYYYAITHCDYDWKKSQLAEPEYLAGFDDQRIQDYSNSFNALQLYSHYRLTFPNQFTTRFLVTGNYIVSILNEDREVVFSRKFILYEDLVQVPMQIKRARDVKDVDYKHNLEFTITSKNIQFQSPLQNVKVMLLQNGQFNTAIKNVKPMYTIGNDLVYKYDKETQFWAGNEFLNFNNNNIRSATNTIARIDSQGGVYNNYLYTDNARGRNIYTYFPDINGNYIINNLGAENYETEADYAWIFFSLSAPAYYGKSDIYITGMFNNYALTADNKMDYNKDKAIYEKAIMIKQGYTNYKYTIADKSGKIDAANAIDGNFYQTEDNYFALVYYRENNQRYDRVIGKGIATSTNISN